MSNGDFVGNLSKAHTELNQARDNANNVELYKEMKIRVAIAAVHCFIELTAQVRDYVKHSTSSK